MCQTKDHFENQYRIRIGFFGVYHNWGHSKDFLYFDKSKLDSPKIIQLFKTFADSFLSTNTSPIASCHYKQKFYCLMKKLAFILPLYRIYNSMYTFWLILDINNPGCVQTNIVIAHPRGRRFD